MIEFTKGLINKLEKLEITNGAILEVNMVEIGQGTKMEADEQSQSKMKKKVKVAYPKNDEGMLEFLYRCQRKRYDVMLCLMCSYIFDRKETENIERVRIASNNRNLRDTHNRCTFDRRGIPQRQ